MFSNLILLRFLSNMNKQEYRKFNLKNGKLKSQQEVIMNVQIDLFFFKITRKKQYRVYYSVSLMEHIAHLEAHALLSLFCNNFHSICHQSP